MVLLALLAGGVAVGLVVGRWWALIVPLVLWVVVAIAWDDPGLEPPAWFMGAVFSLFAAVGVVVGVAVRQRRSGPV